MPTSKFMLAWVTWARGVDLPPVSAATAFKNQPKEFIVMFLQMAHILGVKIPALSPEVLAYSNSHIESLPHPSKPPPSGEVEQLEMFGPWEII